MGGPEFEHTAKHALKTLAEMCVGVQKSSFAPANEYLCAQIWMWCV